MKKYIIKEGTNILINDNEFILRRGVIHKNEVVISKEGSSNEFIKIFQELIKNSVVYISSEDSVYNDFETLVKFGFLTIDKNGLKKPLVIAENDLAENTRKYLGHYFEVIPSSEFATRAELDLLNEDKNISKLSDIIEQKRTIINNFDHFYLITRMFNFSLLRGFNKLMKLIKKINTIVFF